MSRSVKTTSVALGVLLLFAVSPTRAQLSKDRGLADAEILSSSSGRLMVCPAQDAETLGDRGLTITLRVVADGTRLPVEHFPWQDIWVDDASTGDIFLCGVGDGADANTDENGETTISGSLAAGGWTQAGLHVYVAGIAVPGDGPDMIAIDINSPDLNGDGIVNMADVGAFAADLWGGASPFRSDFVDTGPGPLDLADIGKFTAHVGHACQ